MKAERDKDKDEQRVQKRRAERERKKAAEQRKAKKTTIRTFRSFLKVCEFVSPRRERFRDRDAVVFDFRPRPGFKPSNRAGEFDLETGRRCLDRSGR